ncbi:pentapeptide repeat-containing protein [Rhodococcus sp. OK519]|uniref:pentapeptide repeat-containing protein n=1 Tax=Rhodococcus sp. OK519 TaxID=2135729 RepID=UPI0015E724B7
MNLNFAKMTGADLRGSTLYGATLISAELNGANLTGTGLTGAGLTNASLSGANLTNALLDGTHLDGANLADATLDGANLGGANLTRANLTGATLARASLARANLTGASLAGANLTGVNLTDARLTGTSAIPANITATTESTDGAVVTWGSPVMPVGLTFGECDPPSGTMFHVYLPTATVTCTVTSSFDGAPTTGTGTFTVRVDPLFVAPVFTNPPQAPLKAGVGVPFTYTFDVTGIPEPTLALTVYSRPDWFTLTGRTLTGTPDAAGSYPVTITARNGYDPYGTVLNFTIEVTVETPAQTIARVCGNYVPNPTPQSFTDCSGKDLTGTRLSDMNAKLNLNYANLDNAVLAGANLSFAKLTRARLTNATLTNATLDGADLDGATLAGANLAGANLYFTDLTGANLTGASLSGANLNRAYLTDANLTGANLADANLTDAELSDANLTGSSVIPSDITVTAASADGAAVTWVTPAMPTGLAFGICTPASGTTFPVGRTSVTCTVIGMFNGTPTTGSGTATVTVNAAPAAPAFADSTPVTLSGTVGTELPHTFTVTGTPVPQVSVTAGELPDGLTLSTAGVLSGIPTTPGLISFTITAANGTAPDATLQVNATIAPAPETPAQIIARVCGNYVPSPTPESFTDCSGRDLTGTNLTGATLTGANLAGTDLTGADLTAADLYHANLTGADLEGATLTGVTLTGANLTGTSAMPADITQTAESPAAATTWTTPTVPTGLTFGTCTPASGTVFPVGTTTVTCTVTSVTGDVLTTGTGTFTVTSTPAVEPPAAGFLGSLGPIFAS